MIKEDYLRLKELKEENNLSWAKLVTYVNKLVEKEMKK